MGQKVSPVGFRLSVNKDWQSLWYAKKDFAKLILEDKKIRDLVSLKAGGAGVVDIKIERSPNIKVTVSVAKPGVVIGRGGLGLAELRQLLSKTLAAKVDIVVEEVRHPQLSARLVAEEMAKSITKRIPVKRLMNQAGERVMAAGARGVKVVVSGVIRGPSSIARRERMVRGSVPSQTLRAGLDFARATAFTSYGTLGVKVWIYLGEK